MHRESGTRNPFHTSLFLRQLPARISLGEFLAHGFRYSELGLSGLRSPHRFSLSLTDRRVCDDASLVLGRRYLPGASTRRARLLGLGVLRHRSETAAHDKSFRFSPLRNA